MTNSEIEAIRRTYPRIVSKDQVYRICHISKATALYLLQSGLIPCVDSGKKTRRYRVELDDVIAYLQNREIDPFSYKPPENYYVAKSHPASPHHKQAHIPNDLIPGARSFFEDKLQKFNDVLTTTQVSKFLGYSKTTVVNWYEKQEIKCFFIKNKLIFPKEYLIDFIVSDRCNYIHLKSNRHIALIKEYLSAE